MRVFCFLTFPFFPLPAARARAAQQLLQASSRSLIKPLSLFFFLRLRPRPASARGAAAVQQRAVQVQASSAVHTLLLAVGGGMADDRGLWDWDWGAREGFLVFSVGLRAGFEDY